MSLLYGAGLRLLECLELRVKDVDFAANQVVVRRGKGRKDRRTLLPAVVKEPLAAHLAEVRSQHERDLDNGVGAVVLPYALDRKYPNAAREWGWQFVFPAGRVCRDPRWGPPSRYHLHESVVQRAVTAAAGGGREARRLPHVPALVCDAPCRREHHDDLHARAESRCAGCAESRRSVVMRQPHSLAVNSRA